MKNFLRTKKLLAITLSLMLLVIASSCTKNNENTPNSEVTATNVNWEFYNERAEAFVVAMADDDFDTAAAMFNEAMAQGLGVSELQDFWSQINVEAGAFVNVHEIENATSDGHYRCFITSRHESSGVVLRVTFSEDGLIAGLFIVDYPTISDEENPQAINQREGFTDFPVVIGEETDFPLDGILSIPDNVTGKIPAVVIVHGSGAHDMDGTLLANKPYRDIAEYLASNGIASIRYNKRTLTHGAKVDGSWTVREETIEDAILATEILKADPRIDENRIFITGHSMGGMLAPRIHAEGGNYAGLILLAGSPRFLLDISKDQNIAEISDTFEGEEKEAALTQIEELWDLQVDGLVSLPDDTAKNTPVPGWGVSAFYFKDLYEHPASAYIGNITVPFLVLQGSNDVQIFADVDFMMYQELLEGHPTPHSNYTKI